MCIEGVIKIFQAMKKKNGFFFGFIGAILMLILLEVVTLFILGPIGFFQGMENTEGAAYLLTKYLPYLRLGLLAIIIWTAYKSFVNIKRYQK